MPTGRTLSRARASATLRKEWEPDFLVALARYGVVSYACEAVSIARSTAYDHRESSAEFSAAWNEACEVAADVLEREAFRRAVEGWDEQHVSAKGEVYSVTKYDSQLLQFLLRARRPEKFRETQRHEIGGVGEAAIHFVLSPGEQHGKAQPREIEE